ncbi:uncharacterized protein cd28 [Osmerus mordax]|uniref:uncharacterized protein cd28 n=1 Tax=Osmerus mordax TaxID=8014 RepID=UPI00350F1072
MPSLMSSVRCVVALLSIIIGSIGSQIFVKQYPQKIRTVPGGNVALVCEFNHQKNDPNTVHVSWHRRKSNGSSGTEKLVQSSNIHFYGNTSKGYSILVLEDIQFHDGVMYLCEVLVIFPPPELARGNGTLLEIDGHQNYTEQPVATQHSINWWNICVAAALSGSCSIALMASITILVGKCKTSKKRFNVASGDAAPQEYEDMNTLRGQMVSLSHL